jgi:hypothetical protein
MSLLIRRSLASPSISITKAISVATLQKANLATVSDKPFTIATPPPAPYANVTTKPPKAALKLKSGEVFHGTSFGANIPVSGEIVFTTSVVGYPESMTDPSYRGQILVFTQPLIGMFSLFVFNFVFLFKNIIPKCLVNNSQN